MTTYDVTTEPAANGINHMVVDAHDEDHARQIVGCYKIAGANLVPISVREIS